MEKKKNVLMILTCIPQQNITIAHVPSGVWWDTAFPQPSEAELNH